MSWYDATYRRRAAISVVNTGGGATQDIDVVIPADWSEFWQAQTDASDTAGVMIRVTAADGYTLVAYSVDNGSGGAWSTSARTGRIRIDGTTLPGDATELGLLWLYYDPSTSVASAAVVTTISGALTGYIEQSSPADRVFDATAHRPGSQRPPTITTKTSVDEQIWYVRVDHLLQSRRTRFAGRLLYEEPWAAVITAADSGGSAYTSLYDTTKMRWVEVSNRGKRRLFLAVYIKAGVSGTNYTAKLAIKTIAPATALATRRLIEARIGVRVYDVLEAAT